VCAQYLVQPNPLFLLGVSSFRSHRHLPTAFFRSPLELSLATSLVPCRLHLLVALHHDRSVIDPSLSREPSPQWYAGNPHPLTPNHHHLDLAYGSLSPRRRPGPLWLHMEQTPGFDGWNCPLI
jgi:hypothetical protein